MATLSERPHCDTVFPPSVPLHTSIANDGELVCRQGIEINSVMANVGSTTAKIS